MVYIDSKLKSRDFYETINPKFTLEWRRKGGDAAVAFRSKAGAVDYNYVTGKTGSGSEFLDDIFEKKLDAYSHLGTITAGYVDPYPWGKIAFNLVKDEIFKKNWFEIDNWKISGHMFFGYSNYEYGEPAHGAVGSDWHMFPTLNVFVMVAGKKKWMTRPPNKQEQFEGESQMFPAVSGREASGAEFDHDTVYLEPGDMLLNVPYEWHKVLNAKGLTLGAAFRVIDHEYISKLANRKTTLENMPDFIDCATEDITHTLTSLRYASLDPNRSQMMLNDCERIYPLLLKSLIEARGI